MTSSQQHVSTTWSLDVFLENSETGLWFDRYISYSKLLPIISCWWFHRSPRHSQHKISSVLRHSVNSGLHGLTSLEHLERSQVNSGVFPGGLFMTLVQNYLSSTQRSFNWPTILFWVLKNFLRMSQLRELHRRCYTSYIKIFNYPYTFSFTPDMDSSLFTHLRLGLYCLKP